MTIRNELARDNTQPHPCPLPAGTWFSHIVPGQTDAQDHSPPAREFLSSHSDFVSPEAQCGTPSYITASDLEKLIEEAQNNPRPPPRAKRSLLNVFCYESNPDREWKRATIGTANSYARVSPAPNSHPTLPQPINFLPVRAIPSLTAVAPSPPPPLSTSPPLPPSPLFSPPEGKFMTNSHMAAASVAFPGHVRKKESREDSPPRWMSSVPSSDIAQNPTGGNATNVAAIRCIGFPLGLDTP